MSLLRFSVKFTPRFCDFPFFSFHKVLNLAPMKSRKLIAIVLLIISLSACSNNRLFRNKSIYNYPNASQNGTTIKLKTPRIQRYDLTIDNNQSLSVVVGAPIIDTRKKVPGVTNLSSGHRMYITIKNVPAGEHTLLVQTDYKYPFKNYVSDTIKVTTSPENPELMIKAKKPKYSTGFNILVATLGAVVTSFYVAIIAIIIYW